MERLSPEQLADKFDASFAESAFRLELLDHYVADNETESLRQFVAGQIPDRAWREPWQQYVRSVLAGGRSMARVHVVTEPLSIYTLFEIICAYPANVEAGEDVRILPRGLTAELELPCRDYWLLDAAQVAYLEYDADGNWLSVDLTDAPSAIDEACRARDVVMAHAIPLNDYLNHINPSTEERGHGRPQRRAS